MDCDIILTNVRVFQEYLKEFPLNAAFSVTCFKEGFAPG